MKRGIQNLLLFVILIGLTNCEKKTQTILYDSKYKKEIAEVRKQASLYLMLNNVPGATMAISKDGKIVYSEGMGLASKDLQVPVSRNTKFRVGEISGLFTSLMYQMMVENGTLHPDSTVQAYIPDFPLSNFRGTANKITLNQLVAQSSGIRPQYSSEQKWDGRSTTLQKSIDMFKDDPLESVPGWYESPSTYNYNLLGAIMEKATGKYFPELLHEYIIDSLDLTNTAIDNPFTTVPGRTDFFDFNMVSQVVKAAYEDFRYRAPSDGVLSNAEDLVKFGNIVMNSEKISDQIKQRLFVPTKLYGDFPPTLANGWIVQKNNLDQFYYGKIGGVTGGGAVLLLIPDEKLAVAVAVNLTSTSEIPVFTIFGSFLPKIENNNHEGE
jgi:CubicO group peptidase (beta-lactamase class C family)